MGFPHWRPVFICRFVSTVLRDNIGIMAVAGRTARASAPLEYKYKHWVVWAAAPPVRPYMHSN